MLKTQICPTRPLLCVKLFNIVIFSCLALFNLLRKNNYCISTFGLPSICVAAPPLLASTAAVMSSFESVERRLIFHDFLHTLFYKHVLTSRTLYVIGGRRYKGRCIVVASSQHLYVPFGQTLRGTWFVAETDHRPDLGRYCGDVNS